MSLYATITALGASLRPIDTQFDPATEDNLLQAEAALGVVLPALFREIQKAYGHCQFAGEALILIKDAEPLSLLNLMGCKGERGNLVAEFHSRPDWQAAGWVPIAMGALNARYVWHGATGQVLFIDDTKRAPPLLIAPSFDAFLNQIWIGPNQNVKTP